MVLAKIKYYLLPVLRLQLFITLVALPILVYWGLPISALTILGNLFFAPWLALFLLMCSIIFLLEILHLPNCWLINYLDLLTNLWLKIVPTCSHYYLLAFPQNSWPIFMLGLGLAIYLICRTCNTSIQVLGLSLILGACLMLAKLPIWQNCKTIELRYRKGTMEISYQKNRLIMNDHGILNRQHGMHNWLCYELMPNLIKNFGTITIDELNLSKPNKNNQTNLILLQDYLQIKKINYSQS